MRRGLVAVFSFVLLTSAELLQPEVTWGTTQPKEHSGYLSDHLGFDDKYHYIVSTTFKNDFWGPGSFQTGIYIEKYDMQMRLVKKTPFVIEGLEALYSKSFILDGKINVILIADGPEEDKIYHVQLNKNTLAKENNPKQIATYASTSKLDYSTLDIRFSPDSSKILMFRNEKPGLRGAAFIIPVVVKGRSADENILMEPIVFDRQMNQVWKREITLPYKNENYTIEDIYVNDPGNVWISGKYFASKEDRKKKDYTMQILHISEKGSKLTKSVMGTDNTRPVSYRIVSGNDTLKIAGICLNKKYGYGISDFFYQEIHPVTGATITFRTNGISPRVLQNCYAHSKRTVLVDHQIRDIVFKDDGGYFLILQYRNAVTTGSSTSIQYGNDIVTCFRPGGDTLWSNYYRKRVNESPPPVRDMTHCVNLPFYNAKTGALVLLNNGSIGGMWDNVVYASFDHEGNRSETNILFDKGGKDWMFMGMMGKQINPDQLLILMLRKNDYKYGLVTFN